MIFSPKVERKQNVTMNKTLQIGIICLTVVLTIGFVTILQHPWQAAGSAPSGLNASIYKAYTVAVGPQNIMQIASSTATCASRAISPGGEIRMSFGSGTASVGGSMTFGTTSPDGFGQPGFYQATNTTVAYDGGLYGCGDWYARSYASTTITVTEFR